MSQGEEKKVGRINDLFDRSSSGRPGTQTDPFWCLLPCMKSSRLKFATSGLALTKKEVPREGLVSVVAFLLWCCLKTSLKSVEWEFGFYGSLKKGMFVLSKEAVGSWNTSQPSSAHLLLPLITHPLRTDLHIPAGCFKLSFSCKKVGKTFFQLCCHQVENSQHTFKLHFSL